MKRLIIVFAIALLAAVAAGAGAAGPKTYKGHGLAMHGALKYPKGFKHFEYVNPNAPKGGRIKLGQRRTFDSLHPFIVRGVSAAGIGLIYDTLMTLAMDEPLSVYGVVAESIEVPEDRSWVIFTLRKEARFHDGKPITAEDVVFSFNILLKKGLPFYRAYYGNVIKVEALGRLKVKFSFKPGENRELPLILGELVVLPKHYWKDRDFEKTTLTPPLGSGPYKIGKVEPGRSITYHRVADYWAKDLPVNRGRYNFDVLRYDYYRDGTVAREALKAGHFDFWIEVEAKAWAAAYDIKPVRKGWLVKRRISHRRSTGMQAFAFNLRRAMFQDVRVRQALAYAFDFERTNKDLFYGQYKRTRSYFENSELASSGLPTGAELEILERFRGRIPDEVFTKEYRPPLYDGTGNIRKGLRPALRLLKAAGWVVKDRKLVNLKTGRQMIFQIMVVSPAFERIVLPFIGNLKRLGVAATLRLVDPAQYQNRLTDFDFDIIVENFGQSLSPGNEQRAFWSTASARIKGGRNTIGIQDKAIDELVELIIAAPDRNSLVARTRALDRVLLWNHFVIPQWHIPYDRLVQWDKFGFPKVTPTRGSSSTTWWLDRKKAEALVKVFPRQRAD